MRSLFRLPVILSLVLALLASFACSWLSPSHACCKPSEAYASPQPHSDQMAACCAPRTHPASQQALIFPAPAAPPVSVSDAFFLDLDLLSGEALRTLEATAFVPDQSGRHLELSVLLN